MRPKKLTFSEHLVKLPLILYDFALPAILLLCFVLPFCTGGFFFFGGGVVCRLRKLKLAQLPVTRDKDLFMFVFYVMYKAKAYSLEMRHTQA